MITFHCPSCGQPAKPPLELVVEGDVVAANGKVVRVSPSLGTLLASLAKAAPRPVYLTTLIDELYGLKDEPETADNGISVRICTARKLLRPLGYQIESVKGAYGLRERAYRLARRAA
jgi:DNA-binding winged helix-turn-helix (wHTH) protein